MKPRDQLDPTKILASNRFIPIQLAPDYSEGFVSIMDPMTSDVHRRPANVPLSGGHSPAGATYYPAGNRRDALRRARRSIDPTTRTAQPADLLVLEHPHRRQDPDQQLGDLVHRRRPDDDDPAIPSCSSTSVLPGRRLRILCDAPTARRYNPEFLFLVNGVDDNHDGYIDKGWDGVDNDRRRQHRSGRRHPRRIDLSGVDRDRDLAGSRSLQRRLERLPYTITRRPSSSPDARETPCHRMW